MTDIAEPTLDLEEGPEVVEVVNGEVVEEIEPAKAEVLTDDPEEWLTKKEIKAGGGFRADELKRIYWLNIRQLIEFTKRDDETPDTDEGDIAFNTWFANFIKAEGIEEEENQKKKGRGKVNFREFVGKGWQQPKNYMTKWWGDAGYTSYSAAGDAEIRKLTVALGAIQSVVSVIVTTGKRYTVEFAQNDGYGGPPVNYTEFETGKIVVSTDALLNKDLNEDDAIEISTGYGLHEASHPQYTESIVDCLTKPSELKPYTVAAKLFNVIDDGRIEMLTSRRFPGFANYFVKMLAYLWSVTKDAIPKNFGWGPSLDEKLNAIVAIVRWPVEFEPIARKNPKLSAEFDWFRAWTDRYMTEKVTARQALVEAMEHLNSDPETKKQMEERKQGEEKSGLSGNAKSLTDKQFRKLMKELERQLGSNSLEPCPNPTNGKDERKVSTDRQVSLSPKQWDQVKKLFGAKLRVEDPVVTMVDMYGTGFGGPKILSLKPELDKNARMAYRRPTDLVAKLRSAFFFRKAAPQWSERLLRAGQIDEEETWRFAANDFRFFERRITADVPETSVTLLIDMSGSMNGARIATAYELGNVMLECLKTMKGVRVRVRGHTTGAENPPKSGECIIYRLWEPGDPVERLGLIDTLGHGWNYDGFAVGWCAEEMLADSRPRENQVMFVLSDGKPNARGFPYSGRPAMDHVRKVTDHYAKEGVTIIQIAIDPEMRRDDQARMYSNWIPFETRDKLAGQLTKSLIKLFGGE
jgi:hypothetical protein